MLFSEVGCCALGSEENVKESTSSLARARVHRFSFFAFTASPTLRNLLRLRALGVKAFAIFPSPFVVCGADVPNEREGAQRRSDNAVRRVKPGEGKGEGKAFTRNALFVNGLEWAVKG